jgi:Na+/alanine symporter
LKAIRWERETEVKQMVKILFRSHTLVNKYTIEPFKAWFLQRIAQTVGTGNLLWFGSLGYK